MSKEVAELVWAWAKKLPPWQSDLVRRLCEVDALDDAGREAVGRMLLAEYEGLVDGEEAPAPVLLSRDHLPRTKAPGSSVKLRRIEGVVGLGAVATGHTLRFDDGLTIVYGANGAGKSSYAKLLKNACRPRHADADPVLANVYDDEEVHGVATFVIDDDGERCVTRAHEAAPEPALRSVRIFDEGAVEAYMGKVGAPPDLVPAPLHLLTRLARELSLLRAWCDEQDRLRREQEPRLSPAAVELLELRAAAGADPETVLAELALDDRERARAALLDELLAETNEVEAERRRSATSRWRSDIARVSQALADMEAAVNEGAVERLHAAQERLARAERAVTAMNEAAAAWQLAPETGGPAWRTMWSAATAFHGASEGGALAEAARCPLCRAPVAEDTRGRLRFLAEWICGEAEEERRRAAQEVEELTAALTAVEIDDELLERALGPALPAAVAVPGELFARARAFVRASAARSRALRSAEALPPLPPAPLAEIDALVEAAQRAEEMHRKVMAPEDVEELAREHAVLCARRELLAAPEAVAASFASRRRAKAIARAKKAAAPNKVTKKQSELAEEAITMPLKSAFAAEKEALDLSYLPLDLDPSTRAASTRTEVVLREAKRRARVKDVLSCGERRIAALAFFLAEASVSDDGPIVLDDPVSSLDQDRIDHVARRLVEEAARRQVVVFTHDIGLKNMLEDLADNAELSHATVVVIRHGLTAGILTDTRQWIGANASERADMLAKRLKEMNAIEGDDQDTYRWHCVAFLTHLRSAWERAVETEMLHKAVERFNRAIRPGSLKHVRVTGALVDTVALNMDRCARALHDQHHRSGIRMPTTAELRVLLDDFSAFIKQCRDLKKAAEKGAA